MKQLMACADKIETIWVPALWELFSVRNEVLYVRRCVLAYSCGVEERPGKVEYSHQYHPLERERLSLTSKIPQIKAVGNE